ncbi:MAG: nitroreductase family protein [Anaerolineaceae bacterium]|nr:nitroreductase family protein [Anaerolineaceae bacterium]
MSTAHRAGPGNTDAAAQALLHEYITGRRSPRNYLDRPVDRATLLSLLEAARRGASSNNSQPWNFIVAGKENPAAWERLFSCLLPGNQSWAGGAAVLMVVVAALEREGRTLRTSHFDTGLAMGNLTVQAMALGLMLRNMGGIDRVRVREHYGIPPTHEPICGVALGWPAPPDALPESRRDFELEAQERRPLNSFVFGDSWGQPAPFL